LVEAVTDDQKRSAVGMETLDQSFHLDPLANA